MSASIAGARGAGRDVRDACASRGCMWSWIRRANAAGARRPAAEQARLLGRRRARRGGRRCPSTASGDLDREDDARLRLLRVEPRSRHLAVRALVLAGAAENRGAEGVRGGEEAERLLQLTRAEVRLARARELLAGTVGLEANGGAVSDHRAGRAVVDLA